VHLRPERPFIRERLTRRLYAVLRTAEINFLAGTVDLPLQRLQLFARLKPHRFARWDANLLAGAWVTANSGFAGLHVEDPKPAKLNALAAAERILHRLKYRLHRLLGPSPGDVCLRVVKRTTL
jgi:hypothetical protein